MAKSWKAYELRIARKFDCERRGPIFRSKDGGTDDCTSKVYAIECKLLARPTFGEMLGACKQAEAAASGRQPIAVVKRKYDDDADSLVCMRLETFLQWNKGE